MAPIQVRSVVLAVACIALAAGPSFAQRGKGGGSEGERRGAIQRAQPRPSGQSGERAGSPRQAQPRGRVEAEQRAEPDSREPQRRVGPPERVETQRRVETGNRGYQRPAPPERVETYRRVSPPAEVRRAVPRGRVVPAPPPGRLSGYRTYDGPRVIYRPTVRRSYVVPYGYRPYGYRSGWSVNLYFGRPYSTYGHVHSSSVYGYYPLAPGVAFGAVRIVDAPRYAQVFVDGYYAGVVDDYDGVFQHLNLEVGAHRIEIEDDGYLLAEFDVYVQPGRTITYHANIR